MFLQAISEGHSHGSLTATRIAARLHDSSHAVCILARWLVQQHEDKSMIEQAKNIFRICDTNEDGWLDVTEYQRLQRHHGGLEDNQIQSLIRNMVCNRKGKVRLDEFLLPFRNDSVLAAADMQFAMLLRQLDELSTREGRDRLRALAAEIPVQTLLRLHAEDLGTVEIVGPTGHIEKVGVVQFLGWVFHTHVALTL